MDNIEKELDALQMSSIDMTNMNAVGVQDVAPTTSTIVGPDPTILGAQTYVPPVTPIQEAPAMVNPAASTYNFVNTAVDITQPPVESVNPIRKMRLTGKAGEVFRIHVLPIEPDKTDGKVKFPTTHIHAHDGGVGHQYNITCLKDTYGLQQAPCCVSHGTSQLRYIIPVVQYPIQQGNPNALQGNQGQLKFLILSPVQLKELQDQANLAGANILAGDIFATVKSEQFKSFNFTIVNVNYLNQIANLKELIAEYNLKAIPENIAGACGSVISREEYDREDANYDYREHLKNKQENQGPAYGMSADNMPAANMPMGFNVGMLPGTNPNYGVNQGINTNYGMNPNMMPNNGYQQNGWN